MQVSKFLFWDQRRRLLNQSRQLLFVKIVHLDDGNVLLVWRGLLYDELTLNQFI